MQKLQQNEYCTDARVRLFASPVTSEPRRLKLVPVSIFGNEVQALLDSGAVPNLISSELASELDIDVHATVPQRKSRLQMATVQIALGLHKESIRDSIRSLLSYTFL